MEYQTFLKKYHAINSELLKKFTLNFDFMVSLHSFLFEGLSWAGVIRYDHHSPTFKVALKATKKMEKMMKEDIDLDDYLKEVVYFTSLIHMIQPFFDGNTRMCLVLQKLLLAVKGLRVNYSDLNNTDSLDILYDINDKVNIHAVENLKAKLM